MSHIVMQTTGGYSIRGMTAMKQVMNLLYPLAYHNPKTGILCLTNSVE